MSLPLFETRRLTQTVNEIKPANTFITNTYFKARKAIAETHIDIEIFKGKRRVAPFVSPKLEGKIIEAQGKRVDTYKPAYIKQKFVTTAEQAFQTNGVFYADGKSPTQRVAEKIVEELKDGRVMIDRTIEKMAVEAVTTGQVTVRGDGVDEVIDFQMSSTHKKTLTGSDKWDDSNKTADQILSDIRSWVIKIVKDSGVNPTSIILGQDVIEPFLTKVGEKLDTRKIDLGMIEPRMLPNGVTYYGTLKETGLDIYAYNEWYFDGTDEVEMFPKDKVLLGSSQAKTLLAFGAIVDLRALNVTEIFVKSWEQEDPSVRYVLMQSAPLPIPSQIDAFMCNKVI